MANDALTGDVERMIVRARQAESEAATREPRAVAARYDSERHEIVVEFTTRYRLAVPASDIEGLEGASSADLSTVEVSPSGAALHWETLDVDLSVPALAQGILGTRSWMAAIGRKGGRATSDAKAEAARENGRKGGRPRNTTRE